MRLVSSIHLVEFLQHGDAAAEDVFVAAGGAVGGGGVFNGSLGDAAQNAAVDWAHFQWTRCEGASVKRNGGRVGGGSVVFLLHLVLVLLLVLVLVPVLVVKLEVLRFENGRAGQGFLAVHKRT